LTVIGTKLRENCSQLQCNWALIARARIANIYSELVHGSTPKGAVDESLAAHIHRADLKSFALLPSAIYSFS
jgi:hypothetical protein